jgi:hypothetical protein
MKKNFFPARDAALLVWASNYKEKIGLFASEFVINQEEVNDEVADCNLMVEAIKKANEQRNALRAANENKKAVIEASGGKLKAAIGRHKKAVKYTDSIGRELEIIGSGTEFNPEEYKPEFTAITAGGEVVVKFKKLGVEGLNIYKRQKGNETWELLSRATSSPYVFQPKLEEASRADQWEFRAYGVIKDKEIGQPSNILELLIGN